MINMYNLYMGINAILKTVDSVVLQNVGTLCNRRLHAYIVGIIWVAFKISLFICISNILNI